MSQAIYALDTERCTLQQAQQARQFDLQPIRRGGGGIQCRSIRYSSRVKGAGKAL